MKRAFWITRNEVVKIAFEYKAMVMIISKDGCHMIDKKNVFFIEGRLK